MPTEEGLVDIYVEFKRRNPELGKLATSTFRRCCAAGVVVIGGLLVYEWNHILTKKVPADVKLFTQLLESKALTGRVETLEMRMNIYERQKRSTTLDKKKLEKAFPPKIVTAVLSWEADLAEFVKKEKKDLEESDKAYIKSLAKISELEFMFAYK